MFYVGISPVSIKLSLPIVHAHKINQAEGDYVGKAPNYVHFKWVEMVKAQSQQFLT